MKHFISLLFIFLIATLPGCGSRFTDWSAEHVEQGVVRGVPKDQVLTYLRTIRIYDEFSTVGIFNALWLADDVRQAYVDVHSAKFTLDQSAKDGLLRRQLAENDNFISFYLFSYIPSSTASLTDKNNPWTVKLKINGKSYEPKSLETAELSPEYNMFLSRIINKHKNIYLVKFALKDEEGNSIINSKTRLLELRLSTVDRSTSLIWHLDKNQCLVKKHKE